MFKLKTFKATAGKFIALQEFAQIVQHGSIADINAALAILETKFTGKGWQANFAKLKIVINTMLPQYTIFAAGNSKLPFQSFSTLPAVTCAGAGACLDFCYSFRAWRYPAAFARQVQNALLMRFNQAAIKNALVRQAASPVRWVETVQAMAAQGVTHVVECGPGKVLTGMTKRIHGELNGLAVYDPATLAETLAVIKA